MFELEGRQEKKKKEVMEGKKRKKEKEKKKKKERKKEGHRGEGGKKRGRHMALPVHGPMSMDKVATCNFNQIYWNPSMIDRHGRPYI